MAITTAVCNSFKDELAQGVHNLESDVLKLALYTSSATLNAATTAYSATNELSGNNYTAGGETVTGVSGELTGGIYNLDFDDVEWLGITAANVRGALLYNSSQANRAICVFDFGSTQSFTGVNFTVQLESTGILRIS